MTASELRVILTPIDFYPFYAVPLPAALLTFKSLLEMFLLERPDLGNYRFIMMEERKEEEKKPSIQGDSNPRPLELLLPRPVLYTRAASAAQLIFF